MDFLGVPPGRGPAEVPGGGQGCHGAAGSLAIAIPADYKIPREVRTEILGKNKFGRTTQILGKPGASLGVGLKSEFPIVQVGSKSKTAKWQRAGARATLGAARACVASCI